MKFIGVIAALSFLVAGSVSAHAADLGLDCPEDNTYTPSPPQMLNKNVTPYTYTPIPKPPSKVAKSKVVCGKISAPKGQAYYQKQLQTMQYPASNWTPSPVNWSQAELEAQGWMATASGLGVLYETPAGNWVSLPGTADLFNKWGFVYGSCKLNNAPECAALFAYQQTAGGFSHITDPVLKADMAITAYLEYLDWAKAQPDPAQNYTCVNWQCTTTVNGNTVTIPIAQLPKIMPALDWIKQNVASFEASYCSNTAAAPKGKTYYHDLLQPLNSVQLPPGKYTWTDAEIQSFGYSTTAINLGLVYQDGDGNWKKYSGTAELFNKWGLDGSCGGNNADCIVVNAYMHGSQLPQYANITDQILKVNTIVTDFLEYYSYAVAWIKTNGVSMCISNVCYKDGVVVPNVTTPPSPPKFADWVAQKY